MIKLILENEIFIINDNTSYKFKAIDNNLVFEYENEIIKEYSIKQIREILKSQTIIKEDLNIDFIKTEEEIKSFMFYINCSFHNALSDFYKSDEETTINFNDLIVCGLNYARNFTYYIHDYKQALKEQLGGNIKNEKILSIDYDLFRIEKYKSLEFNVKNNFVISLDVEGKEGINSIYELSIDYIKEVAAINDIDLSFINNNDLQIKLLKEVAETFNYLLSNFKNDINNEDEFIFKIDGNYIFELGKFTAANIENFINDFFDELNN